MEYVVVNLSRRNKMNLKKVGFALSIIISLSVIITTIFKVDSRYQKVAEAEKLKTELENVQKQSMAADKQILKTFELQRLQSRVDNLEERMWKLLSASGKIENMPTEIKDEYRRLESEKKKAEKQIEKLLEEIEKEDNPQ
jgi:uncharacterized phage infection (PIP) family protein YhgE